MRFAFFSPASLDALFISTAPYQPCLLHSSMQDLHILDIFWPVASLTYGDVHECTMMMLLLRACSCMQVMRCPRKPETQSRLVSDGVSVASGYLWAPIQLKSFRKS